MWTSHMTIYGALTGMECAKRELAKQVMSTPDLA